MNLSGIKKVKEIFSSDEIMVFDKSKGGREKSVVLEREREYIVPEYQREIKWSTENVQVLIDDLKKGSKFLGTITFSTSEPKKFEIIDGQQRLTVISLIIACLNERIPSGKRITNLCKIYNQSFPYFYEAVEYKFEYEKIIEENRPLYERIINSDYQNQKDSFARIWKSIVERIEKIEEKEREALLLALCESEINVIVNEIEGTDTQRKFCVDYFIDINNKSVELDSLDIIRAFAFKEDFNKTTQRWVSIQNKCNELLGKVKYTREELYYQYFICTVNKQIDYSISKLSNDYQIKESVEVFGKKYAAGTYVWNLFRNDKYYAKLLMELDEYLDFIGIVVSTETGGDDRFKGFFLDEKGKRVDETRILNAHTVINTILRNEDMIPKMMIMKFFLEVLKPSNVKRNKYRILSSINVIATVFTLSTKRKGSGVIASKLLQEDWQSAIREYAIKIYQDVPRDIGFLKVIKENGTITTDSGLHAARRYLSMSDACNYDSHNLMFDEERFKNENITSGENNTEHFIINRGFSYTLYMDDGKTIDVDVTLPRKNRKYIATLSNYLLMNGEINKNLKNRPVYEKIEMLEKYITERGIDVVIPSVTSQKHYYLIKKVMHDDSRYPKKRLDSETSKREKKRILRAYYNDHFYDEYKRLSSNLCSTDVCYIAEAEYKLKKEGFSKAEGKYTLESNSSFSNIAAVIDEKNKKVIMTAVFFYPRHRQENEDYKNGVLIEKAVELFTKQFGTAPSIHSNHDYSECGDEYVSFEYQIDLNNKSIEDYINGLTTISSEIA